MGIKVQGFVQGLHRFQILLDPVFHLHAEFLGVDSLADRGQGVPAGVPHCPARRGQFFKSFPPHCQICRCEGGSCPALVLLQFEFRETGGKALTEVHELPDRQICGALAVQMLQVGLRIRDLLFLPAVQVLVGGGLRILMGLRRPAELFDHIFFAALAGMDLQTEIIQSQFLQTALHHGKGCHFFRDKKDGLTLRQSIGDNGCDRLGFSRSRRSVEDKALACRSCTDCQSLRGVQADRRQDLVPCTFRLPGVHLFMPLDRAACQRPDDPAPKDLLSVFMQVFPHHVFCIGKNTQAGLFQNLPLLHGLDHVAETVQNRSKIKIIPVPDQV